MEQMTSRIKREIAAGCPVQTVADIDDRVAAATSLLNRAEECHSAFNGALGAFKQRWWAKKAFGPASKARALVENIVVDKDSDTWKSVDHIVQRTCDIIEEVSPFMED